MSVRILVVEDEPDLARILVDYLRHDGYDASTIDDGHTALASLRADPPALVLLDVMLPGIDGLSILRELRKTSSLPVILLTARVEEIDRLIGLETGADDYVCKPYSPREVVARVKAVLRRSAARAPLEEAGNAIEIDPAGWTVRIDGRRLELTPKEFRLLQILAEHPGRVFPRSLLLDRIYTDKLDISERAIDSHMKNLRRKLAEARPDRETIRSIYGIGFVFEA